MLARQVEATGDLALARRWLELDPLHEPAHRALIRLYARSGDRAAALGQYRECVRTLSRELGVPPLAETTRLYEAISEGTLDSPAAADAAPAPAQPAPRAAPLVGREDDRRALVELHRGIGADGRVAVLEGEAGIGKTRLAEELIADARERGAAVLCGRAYEEESALAYGPLVAALRERLREDAAWLDGRAGARARRGRAAAARPQRRRAAAARRPGGAGALPRRGVGDARRRRGRRRRRGSSSSTTRSGPTTPRSACSPTACAGSRAARCSCC